MTQLKYFEIGNVESGYGIKGITLGERLFSIAKEGGKIIFREECDGYFFEEYTKEQALELLQEAIDWISNNG